MLKWDEDKTIRREVQHILMQKRQWYVFAVMSFIMGQIFKIATFTNIHNGETAYVINNVFWGLLMANAIACMICAWLEKE